MWGRYRGLHRADGYKAIVDSNAGKLFSIVSKDYKLITREAAIGRIEVFFLSSALEMLAMRT